MLRRVQEIEVERKFCATPQEVWDVYTDHAGWSAWAGFQKSWLEVAGVPDRNGAGAVRGFSSGGVRVFEEVVEFDPPKRMTYRVVRGRLPIRNHLGEVVFEPDGEGTRVTWRCRFESKLPGLGPPMRFFVTRMFRKALDGLAHHAFPG
jgi:uncharacterized protein YndB with AHSA1/START domain